MPKLIAQGAEARLFFDISKNTILKQRDKKSYRIKEIDEKLRGFRTRREAKILQKLKSINFCSPRLISCDEKENIIINHLGGNLLKDILDMSEIAKAHALRLQHKANQRFPSMLKNTPRTLVRGRVFDKSDCKKLCSEIGEKIATLHNSSIIHGDLTTSNMILSRTNRKIYFIDFGLSFFSDKAEDKAVDLHLLKEALESKHYKIWQDCFKCAIDSYKKEAKNSSETLKRLEAVEKRGRYRAKKGN